MIENFAPSLALVLAHEGAFSDHPKDFGGMTNLGITKRVWDDYQGATSTEAEMRALTVEMVTPIYARYWRKARCDELPLGLDYAVFDCAVNSGGLRSVRLLQAALGVADDGAIGPRTMEAIQAVPASALIHDMCEARLKFLRDLAPFGVFGKGWTRRVEDVRRKATEMATNTGDINV